MFFMYDQDNRTASAYRYIKGNKRSTNPEATKSHRYVISNFYGDESDHIEQILLKIIPLKEEALERYKELRWSFGGNIASIFCSGR
jgi:hypothetical protein